MTSCLSTLYRWLFGGHTEARRLSGESIPPAIAISATVPAVAGYVYRLVPPTDFQLSARLASVAHLNTRAGRKPTTSRKPGAGSKPQPKPDVADRKRSPYPAAITRSEHKSASRPKANAVVLPLAALKRDPSQRAQFAEAA